MKTILTASLMLAVVLLLLGGATAALVCPWYVAGLYGLLAAFALPAALDGMGRLWTMAK